MTKFMMAAATAAMALMAAPSTASANQCIPEGGNGRLICPFVYFATGQSNVILTQTTTVTVAKPKVWWPKPSYKPGFGKFGGPKFGGSKFGGFGKFGAPKFAGPKFAAPKFGGAKFGFKGFAPKGFAPKGFAPKGFASKGFGSKGFGYSKGGKFGKYGGFGKHGKHVKTTTQTKHYEGPGRKGPGPLASYVLGATWCSAGSLVLNAIIINATENRELTRSEAWQTTAGCWVPIVGPLLVDAYFKANPQWAN
jgi:hypothetical protein